MKRYLLAMTMALCLTGSDGPVAADEAPRVTSLFSDMRRIAEAGDVVGMEVFIVYSTDGIRGRHWAFVQIAEGVPAQPFLVEVSVVGDQIQFVLPKATGIPGRFVGRVTKNGLAGKFDYSGQEVTLARKKSYWQ